jgi:serine/threonine protein phosphatase PrpC
MVSKPAEDTPTSGDTWSVRQGGDDAVLVDRHPDGGVTLAVADGFGNTKNGHVASAAAALGVHEGVAETQATDGEGRVRDMLQGAWGWIDGCRNEFSMESDGPFTTLIVGDIRPAADGKSAEVAIVGEGDSVAYGFDARTCTLERMSVDSAPLVGEASEDEYDQLRIDQQRRDDADEFEQESPSRYLSHSVTTPDKPNEPPVFRAELQKDDALLLLSDGVLKRLKAVTIERILADLYADGRKPTAKDITKALRDRAFNNPDRDEEDDFSLAIAVIG